MYAGYGIRQKDMLPRLSTGLSRPTGKCPVLMAEARRATLRHSTYLVRPFPARSPDTVSSSLRLTIAIDITAVWVQWSPSPRALPFAMDRPDLVVVCGLCPAPSRVSVDV